MSQPLQGQVVKGLIYGLARLIDGHRCKSQYQEDRTESSGNVPASGAAGSDSRNGQQS